MSSPLSADQFMAVLIAEGLAVDTVGDWAHRDRSDETGLYFGPVFGQTDHHTGSDRPAGRGHDWCLAYAYNVLYLGRPDLPGALSHGGICPCGIVILTGYGRCNHAGRMAQNAYDAIRTDTAPLDREIAPGPDIYDGNDVMYGWEVMYSGAQPMTPPQYAALIKANAAVCRFHKWTGGSVIAHREVTRRKPDPGSHSLAQIRRDVNAQLGNPPGKPPVVEPKKPEIPMSDYIAAGTVPSEGGKIFLLGPGRPPRWLSPQQWQHICRVTPYWATLPGSPFYESQVMEMHAMIQPAEASSAVRTASLAAAFEPEGGGATLRDVPALAYLMGDEAPQDGEVNA